MNWKRGWMVAGFGTALLLGGATAAEAHRNDRNCRERIQREEAKLRREIHRHGFTSRQARQRRIKLDRLRAQCGYTSRFFFDGRRDDRRFGRGPARHRGFYLGWRRY
jgi:hypothetical protein